MTRSVTKRGLAALFVLFAALQFNDPDGILWIVIYFVTAAYVLYSHLLPRTMGWVLLVLGMIGVILHIPYVLSWVSMGMPSLVGQMKADTPHIEWVREAGGLMLSCMAILWTIKSIRIEK